MGVHDYVVVADVARAGGWGHVLGDHLGVGGRQRLEVGDKVDGEEGFDARGRWALL